MSIKLDKRYSVSQEITSDVVNKNKLYKNKHGWVNSQKKFLVGSAALLSGTFIMSLNGLSANADEVSYPNTDTSEVTQTKGTTEDGKGYEVNVDRSELQDAANKANQTGVDISQGQETSQTVAEKDKASAVDNIKNNYSEQVKAVREATDAQQWKNDTYQNNSNDANATNASNKQKIDEAVKNAQDAGANIVHEANKDKTLTSKPGRYDNSQYEQQKNEVNSNTQAQVDALNKAAEQARANKKGLDAANNHSALDEAVKNAQNAGVTVNKTDDVDKGTIRPDNVDGISEAIKNDYANQVNEINKVAEQFNSAKNNVNRLNGKKKEFEVLIEEARKKGVIVNLDPVNHKDINKDNAENIINELISDYDNQIKNLNNAIGKSNGQTGQANQIKDAIGALKQPPMADKWWFGTKDNTWTNMNAYQKDGASVVATGAIMDAKDVNNGKFSILVQGIDKSKIIKGIVWDNVAPVLVSGNAWKASPTSEYNTNPNGTTTQLWRMTSGSTVKIPGAVTMMDGSKHDLLVKIDTSGSKLKNNQVILWNQDGAVNYYAAGTGHNNTINDQTTFEVVGVDDALWTSVVSDIDVGQIYGYSNATLLSVGGGLILKDGQVQASNYLGWLGQDEGGKGFGKNSTNQNGLSGLLSAPDGTIVTAYHGKSYSTNLANNGASYAFGVAGALFGTASMPNIVVVDPPKVGVHQNEVTLESPTVSYHYNTAIPDNGANANYHYENLAVEVPDKEKANYNFAKLNVLNDVHKGDTGVVNSQDKVFDGKKIVAGDKFTYDIIPSSLQASTDQTNATREKTESFTFQDKLPDGVKFESLTVSDGHNAQDLTKEFNIAFDPATNTVTAVAKQGMLDAINADLTKTYALPRFHVHVQAEKSGADLANTANIWLDGIKTKSNEVPNKITISEPKKEVTIDGDNADNKNTVQGHVQKFVITMDLSDFDSATTTVTDNSVDKGLGLDDKMSSTNATFLIDQNSFILRDQNGNEISKDLYTLNVNQVNDSNATFSLNVKDPRGFLKSYGGQKLKLEYLSTIKSNENGSIDNIATQNNFGVKYDSNPVHTNVTKLEPHKDVVISLNDPTSINTHIVKIGQTMAYTLDSAKRPANYAGNTTQWSKSDKLDSKDTYNNQNKVTTLTSFTMNGKTYNAGDDITDLFTFSFDKATNTVTTSAKQEYIDAINQPENKAKEQQWRTWIGVTRNAAGHITNTFDEKYNNNELMSNEVYTNTLNNPKKEWDNEAGENSTDKSFLTGDHVIGNVSAEVPTKEMFTKDYTFDKYELQDIYSSFKDLVDVGASKVFVDKQDITDLFDIKVDADKGVVHAIAKDPTKLLEFGGKNINFLTDFQIHKDVAAGTKLENDARQLVNDVDMKLDKKPSVTTFNQVPVKDVQVDKLNADKSSTAQSIDGKKVVAGTVVTFPLATKDPLPANRGTVINKEVRTDKLQDGLSYQGFTAYVKDAQGNIIDATDWFDAKQDGQTITFTGNQKLFDYYNKDKSVATNRPTILLYAKAEKEKTEYKNDYTIVTNNNDVVSNEVKITTPTIDPVKFVKNSAGQDINDMTISRGDQLNYEIAWDLSDLNDLEYTDEQIATGLSVYDDYDENMVKVDKENAIHIKDAKGNVVPANLYSITWDDENGKWTVKANDPVKFLETYKGQKLTIHFMAKASKNIDGDIKNQAWQNTFGQINGTNIVVNHLKKMEPKKDVTVNVGSQESLNNKEIGLNDIFNYKLTSSIRPANYGGVTENWDFIDKLDTKDQFTGQWQVRTDYDITLKDGTVLKKGTDVSKWFYQEFDAEINTVKVKASKEFLDILNMDINKKTEQGFTAYIQAKRIGYGDVKNIFVENYNGEDVQSNEVITHTPEPEKPVEPAKPTPETPAPVAPTPVSTPQTGSAAPAQPELPQMGDSNESDLMAIIGLAFAGLGLGLGAAYRKKQVD